MSTSPIAPQDWRPRGIPDLEPNAWVALRHAESTSVVAGPGAGKTEFLAQRAVYLLETALCPYPHQVLAISFKSDAAANLAARVHERCPPDLAGRFVSMTFDAFTKSLVDRFQSALPEAWRPTKPYEISFMNRHQMQDMLQRILGAAPHAWQHEIAGLSPSTFELEAIGRTRLTVVRQEPTSGVEFALDMWWQEQLRAPLGSQLSFISLNRLAELLLRACPHLLRALRATYPFVFVDEFQDTTHAQYDFLLSAFGGGGTTVTAVGDHRQRIMEWAGARTDAFERFEADFNATRVNLLFNFRSSPELVQVQHIVARALDAGSMPMESRATAQLDGGVVQVWNSTSRRAEAQHLAQWIAEDMVVRNKHPRDYALLVRQKADEFETELKPWFAAHGISLRNESRVLGRTTLQDLLADEAASIAVAALRLGAKQRAPLAWGRLSTAVYALRAVDTDNEVACHRADLELKRFLDELRLMMTMAPPGPESSAEISQRIFDFLDAPSIARVFLPYSRNDLLLVMMEAFNLHLGQCADGATTWNECIERFEGTEQIPMMTVHKSKGLEYDTIAFIGLDDKSWWSHNAGNPEGIATFFVALSRAKQRAIFLFCRARGARRRVADLYQLLTDAGIEETEIF